MLDGYVSRPVVGFEGLYSVTSCGLVYSHITDSFRKPRDRHGYLRLNLSKKGVKYTYPIHRLVAKAFIPNPHGLATVNHINRVKHDNSVENLEWMTHSDNSLHANGKVRLVRNPQGCFDVVRNTSKYERSKGLYEGFIKDLSKSGRRSPKGFKYVCEVILITNIF